MTNSQPPRFPGLRFPPPRWAVAACIIAAWGRSVAAEGPPAGSVYRRGSDPEEAGAGERIVAAALAGLGRADTISARVRQLARVGDTVLKGSGRYVQAGTGDELRFRLETRLSSESETFELLEVCDGLFVWNYRKLGMQPPAVQRIDALRVREQVEKQAAGKRPCDGAYLGGVQRMLALVREWFRFGAATAGELDGMPVWLVEGSWDKPRLAALLPGRAEAVDAPGGIAAADLPDGVPWSVRLSVGKRELFPFRVEWLAIPGPRPVAETAPEVVAVFELYDVRIGEPVDAGAFVYRPAVEGLIDVTDQHLRELTPLRP